MKSVSCEVREIIIKQHANGKTPKEISANVFRSIATIYRIIKLYKENSSILPKKRNGNNRKITPKQEIKIIERYKQNSDSTLLDTIDELGLNITESGLSRWLSKHNLSYKKRHFTQTDKNAKMS